MKSLLAKIRAGKPEQLCQLTNEVYSQIGAWLSDMDNQLNNSSQAFDIVQLDESLNMTESVIDALNNLLDVERVKKILAKDYQECLDLGRFYEWLNPNGQTYTADYAEFNGHEFTIPSWQEVLGSLKETDFQKYLEMEKAGLHPKLQITPIAFQIHTLAEKINARIPQLQGQLRSVMENTFVFQNIKDKYLRYGPTIVQASKDGQQVHLDGYKGKSDWIKENKGILVDIMPTIENPKPDITIRRKPSGDVNTTSIQAEKYHAKVIANGLTPLSYESYLLAQMRSIRRGKPLDSDGPYTLLLDSSMDDKESVSAGSWWETRVALSVGRTSDHEDEICCRASVRVKII